MSDGLECLHMLYGDSGVYRVISVVVAIFLLLAILRWAYGLTAMR